MGEAGAKARGEVSVAEGAGGVIGEGVAGELLGGEGRVGVAV